MNRKITILLLLLTVAALYGVPSASAYGGYLNDFNKQYNTTGTRLDSCGVCHVAPAGGGGLNPYGKAFKDAGSFAAIESLDSDGDGFTNIAESNARTFPGNPDDHPAAGVNQTPASITPTPASNDSTSGNESDELADDIEPYEGSIGPGSALYGLKIAFDNLDETFTFNKSEKIDKQVAHAKERLSEAKAELKKKNNKEAEKALEEYRVKIDEAEGSVSGAANKDKGLLNAQKMIEKHQYVLERLLEENSDNQGLARAYNNSLELEKKFEAKTKIKLERRLTKEGRRVLKEVEADDEEEQVTKIEAKVFSNGSQIEVKLKFMTNNTENFTIAEEIVNKLSTENINALLKIEEENDNEESKLEEKLEAEAEVKENISKVQFEYKFQLNKTDEPGIAAGIHEKLSKLTQAMVLDVLEMKLKEEKKEIGENDKKEEIKGQKRTDKEEIKENRSEDKEVRKDQKEEIKEQKRKDKEERKDKINTSKED
ncbi:MAG: DUF5667 domain-containing protein [Candidatus Methanoperedens sp.]|nr:DUF5667 domain-containing protein [Candidatus Methanoperedens sp.]